MPPIFVFVNLKTESINPIFQIRRLFPIVRCSSCSLSLAVGSSWSITFDALSNFEMNNLLYGQFCVQTSIIEYHTTTYMNYVLPKDNMRMESTKRNSLCLTFSDLCSRCLTREKTYWVQGSEWIALCPKGKISNSCKSSVLASKVFNEGTHSVVNPHQDITAIC